MNWQEVIRLRKAIAQEQIEAYLADPRPSDWKRFAFWLMVVRTGVAS